MPEQKYSFACPACGKNLTAVPEKAGKKTRCPLCSQVIVIPAAPVAPPAEGDDEIPLETVAPLPNAPAAPSARETLVLDDGTGGEASSGAEELPSVIIAKKEFNRRLRVTNVPLPNLPAYWPVLVAGSALLAAAAFGLAMRRAVPDLQPTGRIPSMLDFLLQALTTPAAVAAGAVILILACLLDVTAFHQVSAIKRPIGAARAGWYRVGEWLAWGWMPLVLGGGALAAVWLQSHGESRALLLAAPVLAALVWAFFIPAALLLSLGSIRRAPEKGNPARPAATLFTGVPLYLLGMIGRAVVVWAPLLLAALGTLQAGESPLRVLLFFLPLLGMCGLVSLARLKGGLGEVEVYQQGPCYLAILVGGAVAAVMGGEEALLRLAKLAALGLCLDSLATIAFALPGSALLTLHATSNSARNRESARLFVTAPTRHLAASALRGLLVLGICGAAVIGLGVYRGVPLSVLISIGLLTGALIVRGLAHIQIAGAGADLQRHFETLED